MPLCMDVRPLERRKKAFIDGIGWDGDAATGYSDPSPWSAINAARLAAITGSIFKTKEDARAYNVHPEGIKFMTIDGITYTEENGLQVKERKGLARRYEDRPFPAPLPGVVHVVLEYTDLLVCRVGIRAWPGSVLRPETWARPSSGYIKHGHWAGLPPSTQYSARLRLTKKGTRASPSSQSILPHPDVVSPQLKTLLFEGCEGLTSIPCSFFDSMLALEIVHLNGSMIKRLPDSLTNLKSLGALYFYGCKMLEDISAVVNIPELLVLDLYLTGVKELPEGLDLKKLRILRMGFTFKLCKIPLNLFSNMPLLEVLNMYRSYGLWDTVSGTRVWKEVLQVLNMYRSYGLWDTGLEGSTSLGQ
ncbi:putative disease resistance protein [Nymphaea thermarum]|nr:putative disease resistance protein [Nymphaea thermarum]